MVFKKHRIMEMPRLVEAGHGVLKRIGEVCNSMEFLPESAIITGNKTYKIAGRIIHDTLEDDGYEPQIFKTGEATIENLRMAAEFVKEIKADFIVGVGGGSKIDLAKKVAADAKIPFISVPTLPSHDGIVSPVASIKGEDGNVSMKASVPVGIIADTNIMKKSSYRYMAAGSADVISNLSAVRDWELAHKFKNENFSRSAYTISKYAAEEVLDNVSLIREFTEESVWEVVKPLILSGIAMSIAGDSRPASGAEHMFAHALEKISTKKMLHGEIVGGGTIMMLYLHGGNWQGVRDDLDRLGAPTTGKELNVSDENIIKALTIAHTIRDRYTILGSGLTEERAWQVARETGVVED